MVIYQEGLNFLCQNSKINIAKVIIIIIIIIIHIHACDIVVIIICLMRIKEKMCLHDVCSVCSM